jgi:hypothetical protein
MDCTIAKRKKWSQSFLLAPSLEAYDTTDKQGLPHIKGKQLFASCSIIAATASCSNSESRANPTPLVPQRLKTSKV